MKWDCRLYGHQWRHPGTYEVVVTEEDGPVHAYQCALCSDELLMNPGSRRV